MQNDRSDLEREIAGMPLREPSLGLDRRVLETISQASSSYGELPLASRSRSPQGGLAWVVGWAIAATVLVALSYSLGFRAGIAAGEKFFAQNNKTSNRTSRPNPSTMIPEAIQYEPSLAFQEFLISKQDFETIWGSKETLARFEAKVVYPSETKEGI